MKKILVLHGPNLNLLGTREPELYGTTSLNQINASLTKKAIDAGWTLTSLQTNSEATLIDAVHQASKDKVDYLLINAAAYSHTSIALRDALLAVSIPFIEVHLSNVYKRESFRAQSMLADIAVGVVCGFGAKSYLLALQAILEA